MPHGGTEEIARSFLGLYFMTVCDSLNNTGFHHHDAGNSTKQVRFDEALGDVFGLGILLPRCVAGMVLSMRLGRRRVEG